MGFLDRIRQAIGGGAGGSRTGTGPPAYWVYAQCRRCGEPLKGRIDLRNDLSLDDDGENYVVRKGLVGSGARRCFQTVEVTLRFDPTRQHVLESRAEGGRLISEEEYQGLLEEMRAEAERAAGQATEQDEESEQTTDQGAS